MLSKILLPLVMWWQGFGHKWYGIVGENRYNIGKKGKNVSEQSKEVTKMSANKMIDHGW